MLCQKLAMQVYKHVVITDFSHSLKNPVKILYPRGWGSKFATDANLNKDIVQDFDSCITPLWANARGPTDPMGHRPLRTSMDHPRIL